MSKNMNTFELSAVLLVIKATLLSCRLFLIPKEVKIWRFKYIFLLIIVTNFYFRFDCMNFNLASHLKTRTTMAGTRFDDFSSNSIDINNLACPLKYSSNVRERGMLGLCSSCLQINLCTAVHWWSQIELTVGESR